MQTSSSAGVLKTIEQLIASSRRIMIMISDPVDPDCVASALALRWLLMGHYKEVSIVSRYRIPASMQNFPGISLVKVHETTLPDFAGSDVLMLVDGATWSQFLGRGWETVLSGINLRRVVNIDHHVPEDIQAAIPRTCLCVQTSSTAQVIYEYFIKPDNLPLPVEIADVLYRALIYDSRNFKNEIHRGEYAFAEVLIERGALHERAVDVNVDMREIRFMAWAIEKTEFIAELCLSLLCLDAIRQQELELLLGSDWAEFNTLYKETVLRQVQGFHYGVILQEKHREGVVRLAWRTRNYGNHSAVADIARQAGFRAGGHRNAGGGSFQGSLADARVRLLEEFRRALGRG